MYSSFQLPQILALARLFLVVHSFSECPTSPQAESNWDPIHVFVSNCLSLVAYYQSTGRDIQQWCSNYVNYQKCCLTCQNYLKLETCNDIAYEADCKLKAKMGMCNTNLANNIPVSAYCPKSCNICQPRFQLTCDQVDCGTGRCCSTSYFGIPSVQCLCPSDRGGTYCQLTNPCLFAPCQNGGQCNPSYTDYVPSYTCTCPKGYSGKNCEICSPELACQTFDCMNGGTCVLDSNSNPMCICPIGFYGTYCHIQYAVCLSNPCQNGGTCTIGPLNDGYRCICPSNYIGSCCEIQVKPCYQGDWNVTQCMSWKAFGLCDNSNFLYDGKPVSVMCPVTCGLCNQPTPQPDYGCFDLDSNCATWASMNLCDWIGQNNPRICRKSCNLCNSGKMISSVSESSNTTTNRTQVSQN